MRPVLPSVDDLLPYLRQIDANRQYTNFGPLQTKLLGRLLSFQSTLENSAVSGLLTSSATQGLELAISALNLPQGSKVLVPALTFVATATAVQRCGHIPVVADVDAESWLLTPESINFDLTQTGIKAVIPVSTFGVPQDANHWSNWSHQNQIPVIIDAASSFGAQKTATGITVVFSLHATKVLSTGEGGLIATRDKSLADRLLAMTNFGIGFNQSTKGTNAKLSEYHAAIGLAHLDLWPSQIKKRNTLLAIYKDCLSKGDARPVRLQKDDGLFAPSVFNIRTENATVRNQLEVSLERQGIQTRRWYLPLLQSQSILKDIEKVTLTPISDELSETLIGLPFFIDMTQEQVSQICQITSSHN